MERTGTFDVFLGEVALLLYFLGLSFEDEKSLVSEKPRFYLVSSSFFCENILFDAFSKNGWDMICYKVSL